MIERIIIVDSPRYVSQDPFQAQLHHAIQTSIPSEFRYYSLSPGRREVSARLENRANFTKLAKNARFIFTARQRTIFRRLEELRRLIGDREVVIYEQDPWEAFILGSETYGFFDALTDQFNVKKILVTSSFWRDILQARLRCAVEFVRMGVDHRYIPFRTVPIAERQGKLEFKGTLKSHRKKAFDRMLQAGVDIRVSPSNLSYKEFLGYLRNLKIFIHDESGFYSCPELNGSHIPRGAGLWAKEIECAAQGAFVIRNFHEDATSYGLEKIPLVRLYKQPEDVIDIVDDILSLNSSDSEAIQEASKSELLQRNDWLDISRRLTR